MNDNNKNKMRIALEQYKNGIKAVREALMVVSESKSARKMLREAELNVLCGMHEISWIGLEREIVVDDDNPSAYDENFKA